MQVAPATADDTTDEAEKVGTDLEPGFSPPPPTDRYADRKWSPTAGTVKIGGAATSSADDQKRRRKARSATRRRQRSRRSVRVRNVIGICRPASARISTPTRNTPVPPSASKASHLIDSWWRARFSFRTRGAPGRVNASVDLRPRYEVKREFWPCVGTNWERKFGRAARYASAGARIADRRGSRWAGAPGSDPYGSDWSHGYARTVSHHSRAHGISCVALHQIETLRLGSQSRQPQMPIRATHTQVITEGDIHVPTRRGGV